MLGMRRKVLQAFEKRLSVLLVVVHAVLLSAGTSVWPASGLRRDRAASFSRSSGMPLFSRATSRTVRPVCVGLLHQRRRLLVADLGRQRRAHGQRLLDERRRRARDPPPARRTSRSAKLRDGRGQQLDRMPADRTPSPASSRSARNCPPRRTRRWSRRSRSPARTPSARSRRSPDSPCPA